MFSPLRNRFGIPGVISVIALVFAMLGGAYAANNSDGGKATASAKGKPGPRGKTGKTGPAGPAGPAGPQGPAGAKGDAGAAGANGKDGTNGTNGAPGTAGAEGKSVEFVGSFSGAEEEPPNEGPCNGAGGSEYEIEESGSSNVLCNGEQGVEGSPWAAGGKLPTGSTETGAWAFNVAAEAVTVKVPISFPIRLKEELEAEQVHFQGESGFATHCSGNANVPKADSGHLCVYFIGSGEPTNATFQSIVGPTGSPGTSPAGALIELSASGAGPGHGFGTWAVTG